jgi:CubicO group peptidase (beta-lactamase class C family)
MRRLAARRAGGPPDREPSPRRPSVAMLAAGLVAVLLLVVAAVAWWPEDRSTAPPTGSSAPRATRPPTDPATLQRQLDGVVDAGTPGAVGLVRIGSVTKSFVATLVLQLVGEGRLSLDDNLERWLPGLVPGGGKITARRLANQLEQRILEPLGLDDTELPTTRRTLAGPHVRGYAPPDLEGYQTTAFSTPDADRQLVMATNLNPNQSQGQPRRPWRTSSAGRSAARAAPRPRAIRTQEQGDRFSRFGAPGHSASGWSRRARAAAPRRSALPRGTPRSRRSSAGHGSSMA